MKSLRWWGIVIAVVLILGVLTPLLCIHFLAAPQQAATQTEGFSTPSDVGSTPALGPSEMMNKSVATRYGVRGYLLTTWQDVPQQLSLSRGESWNGTLLLHLVSYEDNLTQLQVYADPEGDQGVHISQCYRSEDGSVQAFDISTLLSYSPSGIVTINAGETLPIAVTVEIPADFPGTLVSFPLGPTGIQAVENGVPTIDGRGLADNVEVTVK